MKSPALPLSSLAARQRINIGLRIGLATFGAYGLALLGAAALAAGLPLESRPDAVSLAILLAFLLQLLAILWVFAAATIKRAVLGLVIPAAIFALWLFG
jgi:hypothetical protein